MRLELRSHQAFILVAWIFALTACDENKPTPKNEWELIEHLQIEGTCIEDHVQNLTENIGEYSGSIVHWFDATENQHYIYGFSSNVDAMRTFSVTHKYRPPFLISFENLSAEQIVGNEFTLKGESDEFVATCVLNVIRRLDCIPRQILEEFKNPDACSE